MPLKISEILEQAHSLQSFTWSMAAKAASDITGLEIGVGPISEAALETSDLVDIGASQMLCITFGLAHDPAQTQVLLIEELKLAGFFSAIQGSLVSTITESMLNEARELFEGIVQGMCQGVAKCRGEATAPSQFAMKISSFNPPDNLLRTPVIVKGMASLEVKAMSVDIIWLFGEESLTAMTQKEGAEKPFTGKAHSSEVGVSGTPPEDASLQLLFDIPLEISVELGRVKMIVKDVLELGPGSIVEIDKAAGEPVDVLVNGKFVARGEVVVIEDNFGVRITEILNPAERLARLNEAA